MKRLAMTLSVLAAICAASAPAVADEALMRSKNCHSCHAVDRDVLGPSYKRVAAKYSAGDVDKLTNSILKGTGKALKDSKWKMPKLWVMPANEGVTPEDAKKLATWILSLK